MFQKGQSIVDNATVALQCLIITVNGLTIVLALKIISINSNEFLNRILEYSWL